MARRILFSFHYKPDVRRSQTVKNLGVTRKREDAGFFDSSVLEKPSAQTTTRQKAFLIGAMQGFSVVCTLVGKDTANRRWVRYEIQRRIWDERGILDVRIHTINRFTGGA